MQAITVVIASLLRHGITALGANGLIKEDDLTQAAGALMFIGGLAWSIFKGLREKKKAQ